QLHPFLGGGGGGGVVTVRRTGTVRPEPPLLGERVSVVSNAPVVTWVGSAEALTVTGVGPAASAEVTSTLSQGAPLATVQPTMLPYTSRLLAGAGWAAGAAPPTAAVKVSTAGVAPSAPGWNVRSHALRPNVPATSAPAARWKTSA